MVRGGCVADQEPTGAGDDIKMNASFSKGMTKQVIATDSGSPSFAMFGGGSGIAYNSVGFWPTTGAIYLPFAAGRTGDLKLTTAYGFRGAYNHNWDPYWSSSLFGSWSAVRYSGSEFGHHHCEGPVYPGLKSIDYHCNPNYDVSQIGVVTRWTPFKNLTFSAEVMWFHLNQNFSGTSVLTPAAPKPIATYAFKDQDTGL